MTAGMQWLGVFRMGAKQYIAIMQQEHGFSILQWVATLEWSVLYKIMTMSLHSIPCTAWDFMHFILLSSLWHNPSAIHIHSFVHLPAVCQSYAYTSSDICNVLLLCSLWAILSIPIAISSFHLIISRKEWYCRGVTLVSISDTEWTLWDDHLRLSGLKPQTIPSNSKCSPGSSIPQMTCVPEWRLLDVFISIN